MILLCPIIDSVEGITHVFCSVEFMERNEQYQFILKYMDMKIPKLYRYEKNGIKGAVMSKRLIKQNINDNIYSGWDDPQLYTIRGLKNARLTISTLDNFMKETGYLVSNMEVEPSSLWTFNKKVIDKITSRYVAIPVNKLVPIKIDISPKDVPLFKNKAQYAKFHRNPVLGQKNCLLYRNYIYQY